MNMEPEGWGVQTGLDRLPSSGDPRKIKKRNDHSVKKLQQDLCGFSLLYNPSKEGYF